jgi:hypothetical protein
MMNRYEALQHAVRAHGADTDWGGQPYILHPMAVADRIAAHQVTMPGPILTGTQYVESCIVVALLHDVLEDTTYMLPLDDFTDAEWLALKLVTRFPNETYFDYIRGICAGATLDYAGAVAAVVKLADLSHNMSDERKVGLTEAQLEQAAGLEKDRYIPSRDMLWEALDCEWWPA